MSNILNDTVCSAKDAVESVKEGAGQVVDSVKEGAEHVASNARVTWLDGAKAVAGLVSTVRAIGVDDALALIGLSRRRSPLLSFAIFGAGVAVGAGVSLMFAPMSGADLRRAILRQLQGLEHEAKDVIERAETGVEQKAEELSGKARETVNKVERQVAEKVDQGAKAVNQQVDAAAEAVKDKVEDARSLLTPTGVYPANQGAGESNRSARTYTNPDTGNRIS
jgi:gas vesicle protein